MVDKFEAKERMVLKEIKELEDDVSLLREFGGQQKRQQQLVDTVMKMKMKQRGVLSCDDDDEIELPKNMIIY